MTATALGRYSTLLFPKQVIVQTVEPASLAVFVVREVKILVRECLFMNKVVVIRKLRFHPA
jgi:hypothetical protein